MAVEKLEELKPKSPDDAAPESRNNIPLGTPAAGRASLNGVR